MNRADAQQRRERERERRGEKSGDDDVERNRP
jgi:hypothetical protein